MLSVDADMPIVPTLFSLSRNDSYHSFNSKYEPGSLLIATVIPMIEVLVVILLNRAERVDPD